MSILPIPDHYAILGISSEATVEEIRRARDREAWFWSPAQYPGQRDDHFRRRNERMVQINEAWSILRDADTRREYDTILGELKNLNLQLAIVVSNTRIANYATISDAVADNKDNLPIIVLGGTYHESLILESPQTIIGLPVGLKSVHIQSENTCLTSIQGRSTIRTVEFTNLGSDPCIVVRDSTIVLDDCIVKSENGRASIDIAGSNSHLFASHCLISAKRGTGVFGYHRASISISDSRIINCGDSGISIDNYAYLSTSDSHISQCRGSGISSKQMGHIELLRTRIHANLFGILLENSKADLSESRIFQNGDSGIQCEGDTDIRLDNVTLSDNLGDGIQLDGHSDLSITSSLLVNNIGYEIFSASEIKARIESCIIVHTLDDAGILVHSTNNVVFLNTTLVGDFSISTSGADFRQLTLWEGEGSEPGCVRFVPASIQYRPFTPSEIQSRLERAREKLETRDWLSAIDELRTLLLVLPDDSDMLTQASSIVRDAEYGRLLAEADASSGTEDFKRALFFSQIALVIAASPGQQESATVRLREATYRHCLKEVRQGHTSLEGSLAAGVSAMAMAPNAQELQIAQSVVHSITTKVGLEAARQRLEAGDLESMTFWAAVVAVLDPDTSRSTEARQLVLEAHRRKLWQQIKSLTARRAWREARRIASESLITFASDEDSDSLQRLVTRCDFELAREAVSTSIERGDWESAQRHARMVEFLCFSLDDYVEALRLARAARGPGHQSNQGP